ncbi:hypothetical protein CAEBREN_25201 [Caenorhabditis brenneri]|uniref:Secreted protein n=1 Tax=Caenorhabditis brenneri TaxID=135651 RepID=G0P3F3_CAEBE|nr:hypothetical protein CAEBREN_25201 [Caenorhabditis brenneri]
MTLRPKLLLALALLLAFWPLLLGAPLAPPTDCSMPALAALVMTTVAPPTVSATWDAPPTQSPAPIVEEEPCEVDVDDVPLLT